MQHAISGMSQHPKALDEPLEYSEKVMIITSWMYGLLKQAGADGFFLALSGGIDSALCGCLVRVLQMRLEHELGAKVNMKDFLMTAYIPAAGSSKESRELADQIAEWLGSNHQTYDLTPHMNLFSDEQKVAKQNATARMRLVMSYFLAQSSGEKLLVIGTGNRDEVMTGYYTKYDCSCGDLAPIADLAKVHVRAMLKELMGPDSKLCEELVAKSPSAELYKGQTDEGELGMTFEEMDKYFYEMHENKHSSNQHYDDLFMANRHKLNSLPPMVRCEQRSLHDILYWSAQIYDQGL